MELELGVLVSRQNRKGRVAGASAYLKDGDGSSVLLRQSIKDGKLLLEPFPVLEEVGCVVLVELVPPLCRVGIESNCVSRVSKLLASACQKERKWKECVSDGSERLYVLQLSSKEFR